jgi:two-component system OmpR family sensor kinase
METFAKNDFSEALEVTSAGFIPERHSDEIDRLRTTFNRMVQRILQQVATLKQTDILRRELVANVSHDLRTPLASLHGYLETLLMKEGTLTREEHRTFSTLPSSKANGLGNLWGNSLNWLA